MFCDGTSIYNNINKIYNTHNKGYIILGPPGIGKTNFVTNQSVNNWVDMDYLLTQLGVDWHFNECDKTDFKLNYMKVDYILEQSKSLGYRIIGSPFWECKADAIVIPSLKTHSEYVSKRIDLNNDTIDTLRTIFKKHGCDNNIRIFESINEAVTFLELNLTKI